jgi:hypothetical protein
MSRFEQVDRSEDYSLTWASEGPGGSGKSHFLLTAPAPIYVFLFDPKGIQPLAKQDGFKDKDIRVVQYDFSRISKLKENERGDFAKDMLDQFLEDWDDAKKNARTVGWDKEDHVWEMLRYARLDAVSGKPASYYELNLEYRNWFSDAANANINFGVIRGMKEKWGVRPNPRTGADQPYSTGEYEGRGQKEVPELVQVVFRHAFNNDTSNFEMTFHEKCRVGNARQFLGKTFSNLSFQEVGMMLYPETEDTPEVWE